MSGQDRRIQLTPGGPVPGEEQTRIRLDPARRQTSFGRPQADLVFVIDTTGSMNDKIDGLLEACSTLTDRLAEKNLDWRIAVVGFGDLTVRGDKIVVTDFTDRVEVVRRLLKRIPRFDGGGNEGESAFDALDRALALPRRPNATPVMILITDEPPLQHGNLNGAAMRNRLRNEGVVAYAVSPDLTVYRDLAEKTGGKWFAVSSGADLPAIAAMFDSVVKSVAVTVSTIALEAGGDVRRYLSLSDGRNKR
jgi:Mg-chelatase subunit ChlD